MPTLVRRFEPRDAEQVSALFADYMRELFGARNAMTPERLVAGHGVHFELALAAEGDDIVGFAAWRRTYDLHNDAGGGEVADFFVAPSHRGRGVAVQLVAGVAAGVQRCGGVFLSSLVLQDDPARVKLARRWGVGFAGEHTYLAPAIFERMAAWGGEGNTRAAIRQLLALRTQT
jgi:GNAT superfamily N-acetyltransferase